MNFENCRFESKVTIDSEEDLAAFFTAGGVLAPGTYTLTRTLNADKLYSLCMGARGNMHPVAGREKPQGEPAKSGVTLPESFGGSEQPPQSVPHGFSTEPRCTDCGVTLAYVQKLGCGGSLGKSPCFRAADNGSAARE